MAKKADETKLPGRKAPMPSVISPMLCTLTKEPVDDPDYLFEIKWDGYRIISFVQTKKVRMNSRSSLDYTKKYPLISEALKQLKHDVVLDGEVVVFNDEGIPDFDALQLYNGHVTPITYCVFDILWLDGFDLKHLSLIQRKTILKDLIGDNEILKFSESFDDGIGLYQLAVEKNLEGTVAKKRNSKYRPGIRGYDWLKTPTRKRQEFVIGGWAESLNGRAFRSLLFGAWEGNNLKWIGRSGGGYKEKEMPGILRKLRLLETDESPFTNKVLDTKGAVVHWVKPELVANFEFATWTRSGRIRKPATFLGFRNDKRSKQVVLEIPKPIKPSSHKANGKPKGFSTSAGSNWREVERQPRKDETEFKFDDCSILLYNVDRKIWKNVTKAKLIEYYYRVSPYILPHLKNRPQSLHLKLNGATAPGLYIKDMEGREPECAEVMTDKRRHKAEGKRSTIDYLVCNNEATLLWMVNLGCIDINPWSSTTIRPENPDYLIIDLDPSEPKQSAKGLERLNLTAMAAKEWFDQKRLRVFTKTSGKTGIHFLVPCSGFDFSQARDMAEFICSEIHQLVPDQSTTNVNVSQRGDRVYIDPAQNDYADTIAAPYSVRPYTIPSVSTPLEWKEINMKIDPSHFTIENIQERIGKKGELFDKLYNTGIIKKNNSILKKL